MAESEGEVVGLIDEVVAWLATEDPTPLAILGGYGAGKSSFAKRLVTQQAAQALTDPSARRPILIKLGDTKKGLLRPMVRMLTGARLAYSNVRRLKRASADTSMCEPRSWRTLA